MLDDFVLANRDAIISRARQRVAARTSPRPTDAEITNGIPVFLDQLCDALRRARSTDVVDHQNLRESAGRHGHDLFRLGLTIAQVVHDYGDVCQTVTALAIEMNAPISSQEFRTLNLCLDDAIAGAVTQFAREREERLAQQGAERLGMLAHEMRNQLNTGMLAYNTIRTGTVAPGGSTGLVLGRSLDGLRNLIDRSFAEVRLEAGLGNFERLAVADLVEEVEISALPQAQARGVHFSVWDIDRTVTIDGDRQILAAALGNLLQNAFKFTRPNSAVELTMQLTPDRVLLEVEDECGGLPNGDVESLFVPFHQSSPDRSGLGLGLAICRRAAASHGGTLSARDLPGKGCIFTLDLPRKPPPPLSVIDGGESSSVPPLPILPKVGG